MSSTDTRSIAKSVAILAGKTLLGGALAGHSLNAGIELAKSAGSHLAQSVMTKKIIPAVRRAMAGAVVRRRAKKGNGKGSKMKGTVVRGQVTPPLAMFNVSARSGPVMHPSGKAQFCPYLGSDVSSQRFVGSEISNICNYMTVASDATGTQALTLGGVTSGSLNLGPNRIGPNRLAAEAKLWSYYAIRKLVVRHQTTTGISSSTAGLTFATALLRNIGLTSAATSTAGAMNTWVAAAACDHSMTYEACTNSEITINYDGSEVWSCVVASPFDSSEYEQYELFSFADANISGTDTISGYFEFDYVVDFYEALPSVSQTVALTEKSTYFPGIPDSLLPKTKTTFDVNTRSRTIDGLVPMRSFLSSLDPRYRLSLLASSSCLRHSEGHKFPDLLSKFPRPKLFHQRLVASGKDEVPPSTPCEDPVDQTPFDDGYMLVPRDEYRAFVASRVSSSSSSSPPVVSAGTSSLGRPGQTPTIATFRSIELK